MIHWCPDETQAVINTVPFLVSWIKSLPNVSDIQFYRAFWKHYPRDLYQCYNHCRAALAHIFHKSVHRGSMCDRGHSEIRHDLPDP